MNKENLKKVVRLMDTTKKQLKVVCADMLGEKPGEFDYEYAPHIRKVLECSDDDAYWMGRSDMKADRLLRCFNMDYKRVGFKWVGVEPRKKIYLFKESEDSLIKFTMEYKKATRMESLERKSHIKNLEMNPLVDCDTIRSI